MTQHTQTTIKVEPKNQEQTQNEDEEMTPEERVINRASENYEPLVPSSNRQ